MSDTFNVAHRCRGSRGSPYHSLHRMNTTEFVVYYVIVVSALFLLIALVRFSQLKPLSRARKTRALIEQNHRAGLDRLTQLGIRVGGKGPIHFIAPPPYTPDEELVVGTEMEVWVSHELPGVILNTRPTFLALLARSLFPAFFVAFVLLTPILFILRGNFGAV